MLGRDFKVEKLELVNIQTSAYGGRKDRVQIFIVDDVARAPSPAVFDEDLEPCVEGDRSTINICQV